MNADAALNFLGGIPDRIFTRVAGALRKTSKLTRDEYLGSLAFYDRYSGDGPSPELFDLPRKAPALTLGSETRFPGGVRRAYSFTSGYRVKNPASRREFESARLNATARVHLWQHEGKRRPPLVLCLHGFLLGNIGVAENMFRVRKLFASGVDVGLFVLPFHGERTDFFLNQKFINPHDVPLSIEVCAQTQHDLHAAMLALKGSGYERVGLIGASLGGFAAICYAALSALPEFLFAVVPATRLQDALSPDPRSFPFPVTAELRDLTALALDLVTPEPWRPRIPADDICAVIHAGDRVNDVASAKSWIQGWGIRRVVEVTGGHWFYFDKSARGKAWYAWLKDKGFIAADPPRKGDRA